MPLELCDGRVLLRPFVSGDVDELFQVATESVSEVGRWLPWCHARYTRQESEVWVASRREAWNTDLEYSFAIVDVQAARLVGGCGLNQIERATLRANLGYWVRTSATGQGFATAAARLTARWAIEHLGLERLEIVAALGNIGSQRVAERVGAVREGVARRRLRVGDAQQDAVVFSIVRGDAAIAPQKAPQLRLPQSGTSNSRGTNN